jgi:hypothetical protein
MARYRRPLALFFGALAMVCSVLTFLEVPGWRFLLVATGLLLVAGAVALPDRRREGN